MSPTSTGVRFADDVTIVNQPSTSRRSTESLEATLREPTSSYRPAFIDYKYNSALGLRHSISNLDERLLAVPTTHDEVTALCKDPNHRFGPQGEYRFDDNPNRFPPISHNISWKVISGETSSDKGSTLHLELTINPHFLLPLKAVIESRRSIRKHVSPINLGESSVIPLTHSFDRHFTHFKIRGGTRIDLKAVQEWASATLRDATRDAFASQDEPKAHVYSQASSDGRRPDYSDRVYRGKRSWISHFDIRPSGKPKGGTDKPDMLADHLQVTVKWSDLWPSSE